MEEKKSIMNLDSRKVLEINGVIEVLSFTDNIIVLSTILGLLTVKGENLKMSKLDVENSEVVVNGFVTSLVYTGKEQKKQNESLLSKLFK